MSLANPYGPVVRVRNREISLLSLKSGQKFLRNTGLRQCGRRPDKTQETFPPSGQDSHEDDQGTGEEMTLCEEDPKPGSEGVK
jgi:hypothetical protein